MRCVASWLGLAGFCVFCVLSTVAAVYAQGRQDVEGFREALARSERRWERLKATHGETYTYVASTLRDDGEGHEDTQVSVADGIVVERSYAYYDPNGLVTKWRESSDQVGAHAEGAPPLTVDDLYMECRESTLSLDPATHWLVLDFDQQGLLQRCGTLDPSAGQQSPIGINLDWIRFAP